MTRMDLSAHHQVGRQMCICVDAQLYIAAPYMAESMQPLAES
jgi:hypothetical protein